MGDCFLPDKGNPRFRSQFQGVFIHFVQQLSVETPGGAGVSTPGLSRQRSWGLAGQRDPFACVRSCSHPSWMVVAETAVCSRCFSCWAALQKQTRFSCLPRDAVALSAVTTVWTSAWDRMLSVHGCSYCSCSSCNIWAVRLPIDQGFP